MCRQNDIEGVEEIRRSYVESLGDKLELIEIEDIEIGSASEALSHRVNGGHLELEPEVDDVETGSSSEPASPLPPQCRTHAILRFINQQEIVWRTFIFVLVATAATRTVSFQRTRGDMLAGTVIFMVGDWSAQLLTHARDRRAKRATQRALGVRNNRGASLLTTFVLDDKRFVISAILGSFYAGICNPCVYKLAEHLFPGVSPKLVLVKMIVSLSILSTIGNWSTMFFRRFVKQAWENDAEEPILSLMKECVRSCNRDIVKVLLVDLKVWPLYDFLCFSLIPPTLRPITGALMASSWAMYMSIASAESH